MSRLPCDGRIRLDELAGCTILGLDIVFVFVFIFVFVVVVVVVGCVYSTALDAALE